MRIVALNLCLLRPAGGSGGGRSSTESGAPGAIAVTSPKIYMHKYNFWNLKILPVVDGFWICLFLQLVPAFENSAKNSG
jgi:hypothetical protein